MTLDGFVAGPNGELDMFNVDQEFFDFSDKLSSEADTALYGRGTYQLMDSYWPTAADQPNASEHDKKHAAWYKRVEKIVLTNTLKDAPVNTRFIGGDIAPQIHKLKQEKERAIQIFGSPGAVRSLMQAGLIDEYWLFVAPIILGKGMQFFSGFDDSVRLKLVSHSASASGMLALHYEKQV
jgi:dihydrofolate reductase